MPSWTFPDGSEFLRAEGTELEDFVSRNPWLRERVEIALKKSAELHLANPGRQAIYRRHLGPNGWLLSFSGLRRPDFNCVVLLIVKPVHGMARDRVESEFRRLGLPGGAR